MCGHKVKLPGWRTPSTAITLSVSASYNQLDSGLTATHKACLDFLLMEHLLPAIKASLWWIFHISAIQRSSSSRSWNSWAAEERDAGLPHTTSVATQQPGSQPSGLQSLECAARTCAPDQDTRRFSSERTPCTGVGQFLSVHRGSSCLWHHV